MTWFKKDQHKLIQQILDLSDMYVLEKDVTHPGDLIKSDKPPFVFKGRKPRVNKIVYGFNSYPKLRLIYTPKDGKHKYEVIGEMNDD